MASTSGNKAVLATVRSVLSTWFTHRYGAPTYVQTGRHKHTLGSRARCVARFYGP